MAIRQVFEVGIRKGDTNKLASALSDCQRDSGVTAEHYVKMAASCRRGGGNYAAIEHDCLSRALKLLTQRFPLAQLDLIAQV